MNAIATACHGSLSILRLSQESCKDSKPTVEIIVELKGDKLCGCLLCSSGDSTHIRATTSSPQSRPRTTRSTCIHARIMSGLPTPTSSTSFWHSEPSEFLLGHRTTAALPAEADMVIVGTGITGASAARYLAEDARADGRSLVLLEAREACWGATGRVSQPLSPMAGALLC
jgi:hypothetical protein